MLEVVRLICGPGCAKDTAICASDIVNQVIAPLVVAANIASPGVADAADTAIADAVKIGDKVVRADTAAGKAFIQLADKLKEFRYSEDNMPQIEKLATLLGRVQSLDIENARSATTTTI